MRARASDLYERAQASADMRAEYIKVVSNQAPSPAMDLVLDICKELAVMAACEPRRFAEAFDNEVRSQHDRSRSG